MSKINSCLKTNAFTAIVLLLSAISAVCYYASRMSWIFIDRSVRINKFTFILLYIMIINIVFLSFLLFLRLKCTAISSKKAFRILNTVSVCIAILFIIASLVVLIIRVNDESSHSYLLSLKELLFKALFFGLIPFFALFFPYIKGELRKTVLFATVATVSVLLLSQLVPLARYEFTSKPSVLNTGSDYSIVFSTSDYGTGYVEYEYNGKTYKVYDQSGGRLNSDSKIHSINIPYEHLKNNTYRVGSVRVYEQYSYGSKTGKEIVSEEYSYNFEPKDEMTYLVVSDWHTRTKKAYEAISYVGEYDAVILLGDSTPGVDFEEQVVDNIVVFSGELSEGACPVLYVRGNHETRGEYAGKLLEALGLNEFYYNADIGDFSFVVLDSGEDKDDSHPEYGGMTDYNTYRTDMIEWLSDVEVLNDKVIALSHSWKISDVENELSEKGWSEIDRLGASLMISGHTHQCRLVGDTEDEKAVMSKFPEITAFMDGGHSEGIYVASKMVVNNDTINLSSYNNSGEKVFEHSINWR